MKICKIEQTFEHKNSDLCIVNEYALNDNEIDISIGKINGRYPSEGYCVNTEVKELIYCISGFGKIYKTDNSIIEFKQGDAILIDKNEPYFWDAHCEVSMSCTPAWTEKQHKIIE